MASFKFNRMVPAKTKSIIQEHAKRGVLWCASGRVPAPIEWPSGVALLTDDQQEPDCLSQGVLPETSGFFPWTRQ